MGSQPVVALQDQGRTGMAGVKRDYQGKRKEDKPRDAPVRNAYTPMFEKFRDELDEHHDRRMKIQKVSKDVTALSKKIIFSLQRVRKLNQPLPSNIQSEMTERIKEIGDLLATIEGDVQGINRYRYQLICMEEFVEAISFAHYLTSQALMTPKESAATLSVNVPLTPSDYVFGIFDLTGEMMRFATTVTALSGAIPSGVEGRNIITDLQETASMLQIVPPVGGAKNYAKKQDVMVEQVKKVERLGYGHTIRGNERPKGWMPDLTEDRADDGGDHDG